MQLSNTKKYILVKNGGKNIKPGIGLFLGFYGREDNNKCVQLEVGYVAAQYKPIYSSEKQWQEY